MVLVERENISTAFRSLNNTIASFAPDIPSQLRRRNLIEQSKSIPRTTNSRLQQSLCDHGVDLTHIRHMAQDEPEKTYLYLAYGSNMSALTFLQRRGITPVSQTNVVAPAIQLSFDLAGIPYAEPCFGNVKLRDTTTTLPPKANNQAYHKNNWTKGLVGVVYEVTASDFAHIIETEGGGISYHDLSVTCYTLPLDASLPVPSDPTPSTHEQCVAHTLYSPTNPRPDPSYAQPSARYLNLLADGGEEHDLPCEYRNYLSQIRPYKRTTVLQTIGMVVFLATWGPVLLVLYSSPFVFKGVLGPDGKYPDWYAKVVLRINAGLWRSYDGWYKGVFGDGERSIGDDLGVLVDEKRGKVRLVGTQSLAGEGKWDEKVPLLLEEEVVWEEPGTRGGDEMV